MNRSLHTYLVIALLGLVVLALLMHVRWEFDGFFINLVTELIGIIVVVFGVDIVLKEHEKKKWSSTDVRVADRLQILLNATVSSIRTGLGIGIDILDKDVVATRNVQLIHKEIIRVGEQDLSPILQHKILSLDQEGWKNLATQIRNVHNGVLDFLNIFQNRLSPDQISGLMDLQSSLSVALTDYIVFPDLMGVPENMLSVSKKADSKFLQHKGCESTAKELKKVLSIVKSLSQTMDR